MGSGTQANAPSSGRKKKADGQSEGTSQINKTPRVRKPTAPCKKTNDNIEGKAVVSADQDRVGSLKRKQIKQVYRVKVPETVPSSSIGAGALVLRNEQLEPEVTVQAPVFSGGEASDVPNKKQRTTNTRSADPAEAAVQPRHSQ
jgi:hypothetical protein